MSVLDVVHALALAMAATAALLTLVRISRGPTLLDRAIANDVLAASGIAILAVMVVTWARDELAMVMLLFAITGFFGSIVIARFVRPESADERRILTPEEAAEQIRVREEEALQAELDEAKDAEEAAHE
ncbi:monovalent cation/H+ antiporter complex subunit F [Schaalia vaccimaxillae]|uniref:monovalent cation/H+ antiporter complex subunit F n=1 Tax=Schaalia vaccimaxillae TaxID=183916 RepID=UPI0003B44AC1|nr:monovalent cation/H+ antiporter complex subunit F [Schaalia vaccimaxillae]